LESDTRTQSTHEVWPAEAIGFFVGFFGLNMAGRVGEGNVDVERLGSWVEDLSWAIIW
jgi:hypothetical protein